MHLANGDIDVQRGRLPEGKAGVDYTVEVMSKMAKGEYGSRSAKIRALAINIVNAARVEDKDYYGMAKAIHEWVRDTIRYVKDPIGDADDGSTLNQETLSYPEETAFNSQAGDCDDKTILEMALLGSLGLQSYPVVIGMQPGRYSHVYLHIIMPPGKYPHAGEVIPADPIMREWPLGKEAPAAKVKMKKLYTELSGLGNMNLGAYASAPSYLDVRNLSSVVPALQSRLTDTGSRGRIMNVAEVTRPSEDLDDLFRSDLHLHVPMQTAPRGALRPLGPITARAEQVMTSYLQRVPVKNLRASGPHIRTVDIRKNRNSVRPLPHAGSPSVHELRGLADYLSALEHEVNACAGFQGVAGKADPIHRAAAATVHAKARARKALHKSIVVARNVGMWGLGADPVASEQQAAANAVAQLAETIANKARKIADKSVNGSPQRLAALKHTLSNLHALDNAFGVPDFVSRLPTGLDATRHAATKVSVLVDAAHDQTAVRDAHRTLFSRGTKSLTRSPIKTPINGVVRDQMGRILYSNDLADDLGKFSFKNVAAAVVGHPSVKNIANMALNPIAQMRIPVKLAQNLSSKNKTTATLFRMAKTALSPMPFQAGHLAKDLLSKKKSSSSSAAAAPVAPPVTPYDPYSDPSNQAPQPPYDPTADPGYDPSTDPNASPTPDTSYDSSSSPDESPVDPSSEDYPTDQPAPIDQSTYQGDTSSTTPVDTFGPQDMSPASDENGGGFDPGAPEGGDGGGDDDATYSDESGQGPGTAPAAAPAQAAPAMMMVPAPQSGFMAWLGSILKGPANALSDGAPPAYVMVPVPAAAPAAPADNGPSDDDSEGVLYANRDNAAVDGLDSGFFTSPVALGSVGAVAVLGTFAMLKRKKSKMATPVLLGGLAALGLYGYHVVTWRGKPPVEHPLTPKS